MYMYNYHSQVGDSVMPCSVRARQVQPRNHTKIPISAVPVHFQRAAVPPPHLHPHTGSSVPYTLHSHVAACAHALYVKGKKLFMHVKNKTEI